jgi:hypothetical protein
MYKVYSRGIFTNKLVGCTKGIERGNEAATMVGGPLTKQVMDL